LDVEQIRREIGNVEHRRYLEQVRALALDLEVTGVPAFALGEQLVLGGVTARKLKQMIGAGRAAPPAPDTYAAQRSFSLVDQHGTAVSARDFLGEWLLVTFGFTQCPDVCPMSMSRLATAAKLLDADAQLRIALITVDPERDTPEVLARYVAAFDTRFVGLTGSPQQVAAATAAFGAYAAPQAAKADGSYAVNHSSAFYLIDPRGRFSRQLSSETSPEQLAASLKKIINAE
jgi:protein SCO1/2